MKNGVEQTDPAAPSDRVASAFRSAMFWNIANMGTSQVVTTAVFIFLTYRLDPVVFGIFALGVVVIDYFTFQGQSAAADTIVQEQDFSQERLSSAFWAMFGFIIVVAIIFSLASGAFANLMNEPQLTYVLPALALTLIPLPFGVVPAGVLSAQHDFQGMALRGIVATTCGGIAAVAVAISPYPEWALVAQRGTNVVVAAFFLMLRAKWAPAFIFNTAYAKTFMSTAGQIFSAQAVAASTSRALDIAMGLSFGAAAVGLMRIASRFVNALYGAFAAPIGSLWVILLSENREDSSQKLDIFLRLTQMSALICIPVFVGLALTSYDLVYLALDTDYAGAAPILAVFSSVGILLPLTYFRNAAFTALQMMKSLIVFAMIDVAVMITAAALLSQVSVEALVASVLVVQLSRLVVSTPILVRVVGATWFQLIKAILPAYLACLVMALGVWAVGSLIEYDSIGMRLAAKIITGMVLYFGYLMIFHRIWFATAMEMLLPQFVRERVPVFRLDSAT